MALDERPEWKVWGVNWHKATVGEGRGMSVLLEEMNGLPEDLSDRMGGAMGRSKIV